MKAVRLIEPGAALRSFEVPIPEPGPREVLVRVKAAGICRSDSHYRAGISPVHPLPLTLGHEVAGTVEAWGNEVDRFAKGARVCLHYLATCGTCPHCVALTEQFCPSAAMLGKHRDGGYAEFVVMPAASAFVLPDEIGFPQGAIMMCSSATSLHALNKARLMAGESVAVFGIGGLGISAIQLAKACGADTVFAIDIKPGKLDLARSLGAIPVNASETEPVKELKRLTDGRGVDVALELIGLPETMRQAVQCLGVMGRAALAGITNKTFEIAPYQELLNKEAEIIGVSDHLGSELTVLLQWAREGKLDLSQVISHSVPLEAEPINAALDRLEKFGEDIRTVIVP
jgi:2-desacetyl-2-hydroxyethyl bacteriochlorophyllide A dehydrogenase